MNVPIKDLTVIVEQDQQEGSHPHLVVLSAPGLSGEAATRAVIYSTPTVREAVLASDIAYATLRGLARIQGEPTE